MAAGPKVRCKHCNDVIQSKYRHDFKYCKCKSIFIDGGSDYTRMGYPDGNAEDHLELVEEEKECLK